MRRRPDDYDPRIGLDPHRGKPRAASKTEVLVRLNRLAVVVNVLLEELSALRHELGVDKRAAVRRPRRDEADE